MKSSGAPVADWEESMRINNTGPFLMHRVFGEVMRARKSGTIVNIVSEAGLKASPKSGPSYVLSKFGQAGLTQCINAEERRSQST